MSLAWLRLDQSEVAETADAESSGVPNRRVDAVTEAHISLTETQAKVARRVRDSGLVQQRVKSRGT